MDLIANWTSPQEGNSLSMSKNSEANSAKCNKFRSLGGRQYR